MFQNSSFLGGVKEIVGSIKIISRGLVHKAASPKNAPNFPMTT